MEVEINKAWANFWEERGRIWIGDIPDKSNQLQALLHRDQLMKQSQPKWRWPELGGLEHRFYDQKFFIEVCDREGWIYRFLKQRVKGYVQGQYRFNIFISKR